MTVVVTGLGLQSPHGEDPAALIAALLQGRSAVAEVFAGQLPKPAAAATVAFDETRWLPSCSCPGSTVSASWRWPRPTWR